MLALLKDRSGEDAFAVVGLFKTALSKFSLSFPSRFPGPGYVFFSATFSHYNMPAQDETNEPR